MKVLIIPDSFKGTLASEEVGESISAGLKRSYPNIVIEIIPFADGGEGTVDAVLRGKNGRKKKLVARDPLFRDIETEYGIIEKGRSAIIEMASISGLNLLAKSELNPMIVNSFGTGQLILDAVYQGCENLYIGIGGSATNDVGLGMASALGAKFLDDNGTVVIPVPDNFYKIKKIVLEEIDERVRNTSIKILADVKNPLCGENGSSRIYAEQKGATDKMIIELDERLVYIAKLVEEEIGKEYKDIPGAGAAGGLGFGLMAFTNAQLINGTDFLIDFLEIKEKIKNADIIITGEGKLDYQTEYDKLPKKISSIAQTYSKKCICVCGNISNEDQYRFRNEFYKTYSVVNENITIEESIKNPAKSLERLSEIIELF